MSASLTWLLLGVGLGLVPGADESRARRPDAGGQPMPPRTLQLAATLAVGSAAVVLLGDVSGVAVALVAGGVCWVSSGWLQARAPRRRGPVNLALALDLVAAALRSGQPLAAALLLAAPAADPDSAALLSRTGGLLRLGAEPGDAWAAVAGNAELDAVAASAIRSADSGIRLAAAFDRLAADLRATAEAAAEARAQRAGVFAVAPLGLCFLPAFVCLGIVPVVVGIAGRALTSLQ
jgi:Flp pilus assembly protein TadB